MIFYGLQKTTLLDYPGYVASTLFTGGCNFKCPYCHNFSLISPTTSQTTYSEDEILDFLKCRKHLITGVCITGGEPTLWKELPSFIEKVKSLSLKVKLDTNGSNPEMLQSLLDLELVDYVAMDIKTAPSAYHTITGSFEFTSSVLESVNLLMDTSIPYEFRTTIVKELHTDAQILEIGEWLKGCSQYFLQTYKDSPDIPYLLHAHSEQTMEHFASLLRNFMNQVSIR